MFIGSANIAKQILRLKSLNSSQISQQIHAPPQRSSCGEGDLLLQIPSVTRQPRCVPGALELRSLSYGRRDPIKDYQSVLRPRGEDLGLSLLFYFRLIVNLGEFGESLLLNIG